MKDENLQQIILELENVLKEMKRDIDQREIKGCSVNYSINSALKKWHKKLSLALRQMPINNEN